MKTPALASRYMFSLAMICRVVRFTKAEGKIGYRPRLKGQRWSAPNSVAVCELSQVLKPTHVDELRDKGAQRVSTWVVVSITHSRAGECMNCLPLLDRSRSRLISFVSSVCMKALKGVVSQYPSRSCWKRLLLKIPALPIYITARNTWAG